MWLFKAVLILALSTPVLPLAVRAQDQAGGPSDATYEFFSGAISQLSEGKIAVMRTVAGKPAEIRSFLIDGETKIEGKLKVKGRVTVGFKSTPDGDIAIRIIVRPLEKKR